MAVIDVTSHFAGRNPDGAKSEIGKSLRAIDKHILFLRCAADSAALGEETDGQLIAALYELHGALRNECDKLLKLL